jgi:hypothetical protein
MNDRQSFATTIEQTEPGELDRFVGSGADYYRDRFSALDDATRYVVSL